MMPGLPSLALLSLLASSIFLCGCLSAPVGTESESSVQMHLTDIEQTATASNRFALDMYRELAVKDENVFFSPWSLNTALAMTYEGARGKTADEMQSVLHFSGNESARREAFSSLGQRINANESGYILNNANALWVDNSFPLRNEYRVLVDRNYHARALNLDFKDAGDDSRKTIDSWMDQKTSHKIKELIPPGYIDSSTRLVLTNSIFFNGTWVNKFDGGRTRDEKFFTGDGKTVTVPLMRPLGEGAKYGYQETEDIQMLQMPYIGENLSMLILLPKENDISQLEGSLTLEKLAQWKEDLKQQRVDLYIPEFKIDAKYFLKENLTNLGMPTAFRPGADFSGMSAGGGLFMSAVIHQVYVDVNEEGTMATAATTFVTALGIHEDQGMPVFRADHPFIFMILDNETGCILFLGRLIDPSAK